MDHATHEQAVQSLVERLESRLPQEATRLDDFLYRAAPFVGWRELSEAVDLLASKGRAHTWYERSHTWIRAPRP